MAGYALVLTLPDMLTSLVSIENCILDFKIYCSFLLNFLFLSKFSSVSRWSVGFTGYFLHCCQFVVSIQYYWYMYKKCTRESSGYYTAANSFYIPGAAAQITARHVRNFYIVSVYTMDGRVPDISREKKKS